MKIQAIFLILIIFVSYSVLGFKNDNGLPQDEINLAVDSGDNSAISDVIVGAIIMANQSADILKNQARKFIALAKEIKRGKIISDSEESDGKANAETIKDFKRLPPEEFDSQIALYKINPEKTETELVYNNGAKCDLEKEISLKSRTALIKYLDYNFSLFDFNSRKRWPIASLSKLMASVIALEKFDKEKEITISASAVATEGNSGEFKAEEIFKIEDLIKAMLVVSSNDAAIALAEEAGVENFTEMMNKKTKELGMDDTYYEEPSGLSFLNQSTAEDLVKLASYISIKYPQILEISRQKEVGITELKSKKLRKLLNINRFASSSDFIGGPSKQDETRPKIEFLGGKTGYIDESEKNLISFFNKDDKTILTIVLGAKNAFDETKKMLNCYK